MRRRSRKHRHHCKSGQHPLHLALVLLLGLAPPAFAFERDSLPPPLTPEDFLPADPAKAAIGRLLFYDKILSGNQNISCGTCHHHDFGSADGLSLGIGEGGVGVGPERTAGEGAARIRKRVPRNAPGLWNLGHRSVRALFHDGRVSVSDLYGNGFNTPAEEWLPQGLDNVLAAQALFPLAAQFEMAGNPGENEVAGAVHDRIDKGWPIIARRVRAIPEYAEMFIAAFDDVTRAEDITIVHIANAIAAFEIAEFTNFDSPFDAYLAGDETALDPAQKRGMELFYGKAGCSSCHSGPLLTDHGFHAVGLPAFGPGRTRAHDPMPRDVGRMAESDRREDAYRFRTPALRNVGLTAPYGHNGAWPSLREMVVQMLDPQAARAAWSPEKARLPEAPWLATTDFIILQDRREMARQQAAIELAPKRLTDAEIDDIVAFLHALTGRTAKARPLGRPERVPSGLPVD
jgi:cytochrome c peroxidase